MKNYIFCLFLLVISCQNAVKQYQDVEISCLGGERVMVYNAEPEDVYNAIKTHIERKSRERTKERYTILKLKDGSSVHVKGIPPEIMINCRIYAVEHSHSRTYIRN